MTRLTAALAGLTFLLACSQGDGRALRPPSPGATAPPRSFAATAPTVTIGTGFVLTSPVFQSGKPIPIRYSCRGDDVSPPLSWAGVPGGTVELALVVVDLDADDFVHWVVWGIAPGAVALDEGALPAGASQARNGDGDVRWAGPCPERVEPHRYQFTLYALSAPLQLSSGVDGEQARETIESSSAARAELVGSFVTP